MILRTVILIPYKNVFKAAICLLFFLFPFQTKSQNIDSLEKSLSKLKGREKVLALADLCYYTSSSQINKSIIYGNRALNLASELKDTALIASCENDLALSYFFKGNFDSCIILAEKAYDKRLHLKKWRDAGASLSKSALAYYEKGNYDQSLTKYLKSLDLFKKANASAEAGKLQNNIGSIYERNNQLEEAKKMYLGATSFAEKEKDYEGYVMFKSNYAIILQKQGQVNEAIKIFTELIPVCETYCREEYMSQLFQAIGVCYRRLGDTKKGLEYYLKAKAIYEKIGSLTGESVININIGNCYADLKLFNEAEAHLRKGLDQAIETGNLQWQKLAYQGLYDMERLRGNFKDATNYLEKYSAINDSIYNEKTQEQLSKLQTLYNVQQKENTILSQEKEITEGKLEISRRNNLLIVLFTGLVLIISAGIFLYLKNKLKRRKELLAFQEKIQKERSRISKDLHDNMGAELTIISSALDIKAYDTEKQSDKKDLETISEQVRKASALMRDTIWTVSEEKISLTQFSLKVKEFAERTFVPKKIAVHFTNGNSEKYLRPESTLNLFRMVQEVINNAAKHSDAGNFYIDCFTGGKNEIQLRDDGVGYNTGEVSEGYGLRNIINRAKDIGAVVTTSSSGKGTVVIIQITEDSIWKS